MRTTVGILGLGMSLPPTIRGNDWWPAEIVQRWSTMPPPANVRPVTDPTPGMRAILDARSKTKSDVFQGTTLRHVLTESETTLDLEERAAKMAMERAGIGASDIDLVLTCTTPNAYQLTNSACELHERLGIPTECFSLHTDGAQHAFLLQLALAESMIVSGQARTALLVQSSGMSRILDREDPLSLVFGDGATAVVVGKVGPEFGILASTHRTDGRHPNTLIASVRGKHWYDEGRVYLHMNDPVGMGDILLRTVDVTCESIATTLERAQIAPGDVDVFAMHQGMPWLRQLVQDHAGLTRARSISTFGATAHLFGAFVPSTLFAAEREGVLKSGDRVVIAGGGNGMTYGATVMRWGRS